MIPLFFLPPGDQWDQTMLSRLLEDKLHHHGIEFETHDRWPVADGLVLVIPGRYWHDKTAELTDILTRYDWVLAIRTGDEEDLLDPASIHHPNIRWWVQTPLVDCEYGDARLFGVGYSPAFVDLCQPEAPVTEREVFLSAQDNHDRRHEFFARLGGAELIDGRIQSTSGFTKGMDACDYTYAMMSCRAAPAPSGPYTPDTFRAYEALEAHTVPVVDDVATHNPAPGYWRTLYPDAPFPIVTDLNDLVGYTQDVVAAYPRLHNRVAAWWMRRKADLSGWLRDDLDGLGVPVPGPPPVTVVVPTSPIPSHPDVSILDETLGSIRHHFPTATIVLTFDGVRPEQEHRRADYEEYIRRALWRADHHWRNVIPVIAEEHHHQSGLMARVLNDIDTPLVLYVEHDAPLVTDCVIDWEQITGLVMSGDFYSIRLYHEAVVPEPHTHLMRGRTGDILRTSQWSQRPHLATTAFYRRILHDHFTWSGRGFIEDTMHGVVDVAVRDDGDFGWDQWRLGIYAPQDDGLNNFKRSYHTDGRSGEDNYYP